MTAENFKNLGLDSRLLSIKDQEIDYKGLVQKYFLSKWYWYVLSLVAFTALAHFYLKLIEPAYEIRSKILITKSEPDYGSPGDWIKNALKGTTASDNVYNEIQMLSSFALLNQVVHELNLDVHYFWKDGLIVRDGYTEFPVQVGFYELNSPAYFGRPLRVQPIDANTFQLYDEKDLLIGTYAFGDSFTNDMGSFCLERNGEIDPAEQASMYVEFFNPDYITEGYLEKLFVGFIDINSTTIELTLEDAIPQRGVDVLENAIVRYNDLKNFENNRIARNTLQFIDERLLDIGRDLRSVERSVESFKLQNNIASETTSDLQIVLENVSKLDANKNNIEIQLNVLESLKKTLDMPEGDYTLIPLNLSTANAQIQEIVKPFNDLVLERRQLLVTSQPSNPMVLSLNQRLMSLKASIFAAIQNQQNDLRYQLQRVEGQYGESIARLRSVPTQERALLDKSREQSIIEGLYTYLLQKREETALTLIGISSNSLVIDPPRSSVMAVSPNPLIYYFAGGVFGFFFPFLLISFGEVFKDVVQSEEDVKEKLPSQAVIGMINESKTSKRQIVLGKSRSLVSDRFRSLRTNLQFLNGNRSKSIMVTSSVSGEGKTFVAANLAASFAAAEERTLIIDFDLRNQSVGKYLGNGKNNTIGLSNFFQGTSENVDELISSTPIANLDHLPSGPMPEYPDELVISEDKLVALFGQLSDRYSTIIIDTSPVGIITDAILLNNHIDHSLFVIRMGTTKKEMLEKARDIFDQDLLVNPMLVLNGMKKGEVYGYKIK